MNEFLEFLIFKGVKKGAALSAHNLAFGVNPKINATTRSKNQEAKEAVFKGFIGEIDPKVAFKAADACHKEQKEAISTIFEQLDNQVDNTHKVIVVFGNKEDAEYNGLAANQLMSKYNKPILVLREQNPTVWTGSARSPVDTLKPMNDSGLCKCQGHPKAHGITVKKCNLDKLIAWFDEQEWSTTETITNVTAKLDPKEITLNLCKDITANETLWGEGIPEPTFYMHLTIRPMDRVVYRKKTITGKISANDISFVKFQISEKDAELLDSEDDLDVEMIVTLEVNEYNGLQYPQGKVQSWSLNKIKRDNSNLTWEDLF